MQGPIKFDQFNLLKSIEECLKFENLHCYATLDGAHYENIMNKLKDAGLVFRSLYVSPNHPEVISGGPFIINFHQEMPSDEKLLQYLNSKEFKDLSPDQTSELLAKIMQEAINNGDPTGGGLLPLDDYQNIDAALQRIEIVLRIINDTSGVVFWFGDDKMSWDVFYKHLRGLNKILVPASNKKIILIF